MVNFPCYRKGTNEEKVHWKLIAHSSLKCLYFLYIMPTATIEEGTLWVGKEGGLN